MFINPDWLTFNEFLFLKPDNQFHWVYWSKIAWWKCRQTHFGKQMVLRQKTLSRCLCFLFASAMSVCFIYHIHDVLSYVFMSLLIDLVDIKLPLQRKQDKTFDSPKISNLFSFFVNLCLWEKQSVSLLRPVLLLKNCKLNRFPLVFIWLKLP